MTRVGILSDTHAWWDDRYAFYFASCDEIWHAGDIGNDLVADRLAAIAPLRAVHGNIDGQSLRRRFPATLTFELEGLRVAMLHIAGRPGRYEAAARALLASYRPNILVAGHSHILKIAHDPAFNCLFINPGAAGRQGWQTVSTLVRLTLDAGRPLDCEVIELAMPTSPAR